jgi:4-hydroxy-4-methyl-2-oxoglutarate aldolase
MIGYPVWAVGTCPRRSRNEFTFGSINEKIEIGGVSIAPGDYVVADETGVVCVPRQQAERVLDLLIKIDAQERALEEQVTDDAVSSWDNV